MNRTPPPMNRHRRIAASKLSAGLGIALAALFAFTAHPALARELVRDVQYAGGAEARQALFPPKVAEPPSIDGRLAEPVWAGAALGESFVTGPGGRPENANRLKVAWDERNLYLGAVAEFTDRDALLRHDGAGHVGTVVWHDDCLDIFISAGPGTQRYQLLVNANGAFGTVGPDRAPWEVLPEVAASIVGNRYLVEIAVPLRAVGIEPGPGLKTALVSAGRRDLSGEAEQMSTAFGEDWGDMDGVPLLVLGDRQDYLRRAQNRFTRNLNAFVFYADREEVPSFAPQGYARVAMDPDPAGESLRTGAALEVRLKRGGRTLRSTRLDALAADRVDFHLDYSGLPPGEYALAAVFLDGDEEQARTERELRIMQAERPESGRFEFRVPATDADMDAWPVTFGLPLPWGAVDDADALRIVDADGREVPFQAQVVGRWSRNGSIRWLLVDMLTPVGREERAYAVEFGPGVRRTAPEESLSVSEDADAIRVDTGAVRFEVPKRNSPGLAQVSLRSADGWTPLFEALDKSGPFMVDGDGTEYWGLNDPDAEVALEASGPLKATVRASGYHVSEAGEKLGRFILRFHAWAGLPYVQMDHTFIITHDADEAQYRNIGHVLPMPSGDFAFGTPGVHTGDTPAGGAYLLQSDDLHWRVVEDGRFRDEGGKAKGWVSAGRTGRRMTAAVRDFWQLFPKELEVLPDRVNLHFWPKHNLPAKRHGDRLNMENVYQIWSAHEGETLDFRVPEEVVELFARDTIEEDVGHARAANPAGTARTHQTLLYFHAGHWAEARAASHNRVFQAEPTGICDPEWVAQSGAFGPMAARDPEAFPIEERALDLAFDQIQRFQALDRDYGLFNFGDSHHSWDHGPRRWRLHRIWYNNHHGWNRWPWLMYARSGSQGILDWARRNSRHAADVGHANYAPDRFRRARLPKRKVLGGIHDYKGFVHWNRGDRLGYNSSADALFWHHYFTGDMRSLSTAMNHSRSLLGDPGVRRGRAGSGRITSALAAYWHTWDNDYLEFAERHLAQWFENPPAHPGNIVFAPSIERYIDLTGSRAAKELAVHWAERVIDDYPSSTSFWYDLHRRTLLVYAWRHAGDERYLRAAARRVALLAENLYEGDDPRHYGVMVAAPGNMYRSYFMQQTPYYLQAARELGRRPEPAPLKRTAIRTHVREEVDGQERNVLRARLRHDGAGPVEIRTAIVSRRRLQEMGGWLRPLEEGAERIEGVLGEARRVERLRGRDIHWRFEAERPMDYELVLYADREFNGIIPATDGLDDWKEVYPAESGYGLENMAMFHFVLPEGAERAEFSYRSRTRPFQFNLIAPDGTLAAADAHIGEHEGGFRTSAVDVSGQPREGWAFQTLGFGYNTFSLRTPQIAPASARRPFYFAASPEKAFLP